VSGRRPCSRAEKRELRVPRNPPAVSAGTRTPRLSRSAPYQTTAWTGDGDLTVRGRVHANTANTCRGVCALRVYIPPVRVWATVSRVTSTPREPNVTVGADERGEVIFETFSAAIQSAWQTVMTIFSRKINVAEILYTRTEHVRSSRIFSQLSAIQRIAQCIPSSF